MRESRKYGSVRGARDETRVPTATREMSESRVGSAGTGRRLAVNLSQLECSGHRLLPTVRDEARSMAGTSHLARPLYKDL
jgi:hypothetical protein